MAKSQLMKRARHSAFFLGLLVFWSLVAARAEDSPITTPASNAAVPSRTSPPISSVPLAMRVATAPEAAQPFWRKDPKVFKRITDERACIVAAHREDLPGGDFSYIAHGGVLISATRETSFRITKDYEHLGDISDYFKKVDWHPDTKILNLYIEALGYHGELKIHLTSDSDPDLDVIHFEINEGDFKGLSGFTSFEDYAMGKTLAALEIHFLTKKPPLPKVFMSVALEIVTQKVGERLRTYIETEPERLKKEHANDTKKNN